MYTSTGNLSSPKLHHLEQFQNLKKSFFFSSWGQKKLPFTIIAAPLPTIMQSTIILFEITQLNQLEHLASKSKISTRHYIILCFNVFAGRDCEMKHRHIKLKVAFTSLKLHHKELQ